MKHLNRRQWLRTAGLAGAFTLTGGLPVVAESTSRGSILTTDAPARLSSNENPFGPSKKVREALLEGFDAACRYPFSWYGELLELLAEKEGVSTDHIVLTAGSVEGLKITGLVYGWQGGEVVAATPTFQSLLTYAETFGAHVHRVPVNDELVHDLDAMEKRITANTRLVFICNPNNPTGTLLPADKLRDFCSSVSHRTVVFSDEAYYDYVEEPGYPSMIELVKEGLNVIVSRTFSKVYGLAGLRIGYLVARPDIAARLVEARVSFPNVMGIFAAKAALKDEEFYRFSLRKNAEAKKMIYDTLDGLGLRYVPSHGNFVFFHSGREISQLIGHMKKEDVLIGRPFPPLLEWCRISTGTLEDTARFCRGLKTVMS